jgi:hypothetical protein
MWDYVCPRCKLDVPKKSHTCPHCQENYGMPLRVPPKILKDAKALSEYVHKVVMPKVSPEMRMYLTQFFTELFSDGFESGNFDAWDGTIGSPSVQDTTKYSGTYALSATSAGAWAKYIAYKDIASQATFHARAYINVSDMPDGYCMLFLGTWTGYGDPEIWVGIKKSGSNYYWTINHINGAGEFNSASDIGDVSGTWICLEFAAVMSDTVGELQVWVNGVNVINQTGLNTGTDGIIRLDAGVCTWDSDQVATVYIDDVVVADAYIGPESEAALKTVTDALALSDGACRNKNFVIADTSGLTDAVLQHKTLVANDSVDVNDAVLTDKTVVTADAVNLAGSLIVNKALQLTETINLFETVQVGVGGAKKTKLFLIIGDLAVQLAGE